MFRNRVSFKSWSVFLMIILGSFCLSGCAGESGQSGKSLLIWHWMTDRQQAFDELAKRYEAAYGVKVNFDLYAPSDAYSQKVRAAAQGVNLPDVFGILAEKRDFAAFVEAGHILDLTYYMDENAGQWRNVFFAKALQINEFPAGNIYKVAPGIYGVPIDTMTIQLVYNKDLFRKMGLDPAKPPVTFSEFIGIAKKIKENNLQGLVSGWGEYWLIDCFANNYAFNLMGQDKVLATIKGQVPYTDPDWIKVLALFKDMRDSGLLYSGAIAMVNKDAEQAFANEKAVFAFNGSWCVNVYKEMNPKLNYGVMLPPKISDKYPVSIWGGAGSSFMVNARSAKKDEAVKFLKWLTAKEQQVYLSEATNNLPANKESLNTIPKILSAFAKNIDYTTHPNIWGVSEFPLVVEALDKGIQSIIIGEKTPEQVAQEVQRTKEKEIAKKR
ncbi:MAG: extracellular solute-binding protein [Candidatus Omnitrophota bacterium]